MLPLNRENTRTIDRFGGTVLHSTRTNPSKMKELPDALKSCTFPMTDDDLGRQLAGAQESGSAGNRYLIAIGGDDTLSYAARLDQFGVKRDRDSEDHGQRRPATPNIASGFRRRSRAPRRPSGGNGPRSGRMNASGFFGFSDATPGSPRSTRRTSPPSAAAFRNTK